MATSAGVVWETAMRPFRVNAPDDELTGLRRRINDTRWPELGTVTDATQGVQLATTQALARYRARNKKISVRVCTVYRNGTRSF